MAQMVRKQIYIEPRQQVLLKRLARALKLSEAELIRQAIDRQVTTARFASRDLSAWERERAFIEQRIAAGALTGSRRWTRDELYEERLARYGDTHSG